MEAFLEYYTKCLKLLLEINLKKLFPNKEQLIKDFLDNENFNNSLLSLFDDMITRYSFRGGDLFDAGLPLDEND